MIINDNGTKFHEMKGMHFQKREMTNITVIEGDQPEDFTNKLHKLMSNKEIFQWDHFIQNIKDEQTGNRKIVTPPIN